MGEPVGSSLFKSFRKSFFSQQMKCNQCIYIYIFIYIPCVSVKTNGRDVADDHLRTGANESDHSDWTSALQIQKQCRFFFRVSTGLCAFWGTYGCMTAIAAEVTCT